jgi:integrase
MATITSCPSGSFRVQVRRIGLPSINQSFKTRAQALTWARKTEYELDTGIFLSKEDTERITFAELATRYINEISPQKKSYKQEAYRLKKIIRAFKDFRIHQMKSMHIAAYRDKLLKEGYAPASVLNELSLISQVFELSIKEWGIPLASNPCRTIRKPRVNNQRSRRLSQEEETLLIHYATESRAELLPHLIIIALETAMRLGELLSLTWNHVHLERRFVYLPDTKNGTSRSVPLSSKAIQEFEKIRKHPDSHRVFWTWNHNKTLENVWNRVCMKADIENLHFHDLRHEATTRLSAKLPNILELSSVTGHKDLRMLKRYYHPKAEEIALKLG